MATSLAKNENGGHFTVQNIQHWDVAHLGFLKNLHWDIDVLALADYFNSTLKRLSKKETITVGLKVKTPFDGKKNQTVRQTACFL